MDWLFFVRVNLTKQNKNKKAILFNFLFQRFKQIWESGALVSWRSIAWLSCKKQWVFLVISQTDVAFLRISTRPKLSRCFDGYHMQTSPSLDVM